MQVRGSGLRMNPTGLRPAIYHNQVGERIVSKMLGHARWFMMGLGILLSTTQPAAAAAPGDAFTYQGQLKRDGVPVSEACDFIFRLMTAESGGSEVMSQGNDGVPVVNGLFQVDLHFGTFAFDLNERWLDVAVSCPSGGAFTGLAPRQPILATPYAIMALDVAMVADGALSGIYSQPLTLSNAANSFQGAFNGTHSGSGAGLSSLNASNVSSGTLADVRLSANVLFVGGAQTITGAKNFSLAPSFSAGGTPFTVSSTSKVTNLNADLLDGLDSTAFLQSVPVPLSLSGSHAEHIIKGENASTNANAAGVYGLATASSGMTYGVRGTSKSVSGVGVVGFADASTGGTIGVWGQGQSASGRGMFGRVMATTGSTIGVHGVSMSSEGTGVSGQATATTGVTFGVTGQVASPNGYAGHFTGPAGSRNYFERSVGIGTTLPSHPLHVVQTSSANDARAILGDAAATSGTTHGIYGHSASTGGNGVFGLASATSGLAYGVHGQSLSSTGAGVRGWGVHSVGVNTGVEGRSNSTSGRGVLGIATSGTGTTYGVFGESNSTSGRAVHGLATAASGTTYGVHGQSNSTNGRGVVGITTAGTGPSHGVQGQSASTSGIGVFGNAIAGSGTTFGVWGQVNSASGTGVRGQALNNSGSTIGVLGEVNSANGYAGYFAGPAGSRNYFERNVGIGTTNPRQQLSVGADLDIYSGGINNPTRPSIRGSGSDNLILNAVNNGEVYLSHDGGTGGVRFHNGTPGGVLMRLTPNGELGIGVLNPTFQLQLSQNSAAKPTSSAWTVSSDARLKKNVHRIGNALADLLALRGVTYQWIDPASQGGMAGVYTGLIAQEVESVFPEWVSEDSKGFKQVTVIGFEGIVVEALRDLKNEMDADLESLRAEKDTEIAGLRAEYERRIHHLHAAHDSLLKENEAILARLAVIEAGLTRMSQQTK